MAAHEFYAFIFLGLFSQIGNSNWLQRPLRALNQDKRLQIILMENWIKWKAQYIWPPKITCFAEKWKYLYLFWESIESTETFKAPKALG